MKKPAFILLLVITWACAYAQDTLLRAKRCYWIDAGLIRGVYSHWAVPLGISYKVKKHLFVAHYYRSRENYGLIPGSRRATNSLQAIENITLAYGRVFILDHVKLVPLAGPCIGHAGWRTDFEFKMPSTSQFELFPKYYYTYDYYNYLGAELGLQVIIPERRYVGVCFHALVNIQKHPYYAAGMSLLIGKMR